MDGWMDRHGSVTFKYFCLKLKKKNKKVEGPSMTSSLDATLIFDIGRVQG